MNRELLLEIGTEEIPAGFIDPALASLMEIAKREFRENSISHGEIRVFGAPRRLTLLARDIPDKQRDRTVEALGPPKRIAFDAEGAPTKAALGFLKAQGAELGDLVVVKHEKGELLAVRREIKGARTAEILRELLPKIILSIPFRKSMRWAAGDVAFARPMKWILALFGGKTVPFEIEGLASGNRTEGHRFMSPKPRRVANWEEYAGELERGFVVLDQARRRRLIEEGIEAKAAEGGGFALADGELVATVTHLVEYPVALMGNFHEDFLKLPKEALVSVMKNHQKYFPVLSNDGSLLPHFVFICGAPVENPQIVINGNERVIRARFTDAKFFFEEDTKTPLAEKAHKLRGMVFLSEIGTYRDKTERMECIAEFIGRRLGFGDGEIADVKRAAGLSKADLATQMVFEFPELQGTMGKYYARCSGESEEVAAAIEEQYMPSSREGRLPKSDFGAALSITDKTDTICACFISGLIPTGASDPYALRRGAIGIINILLDREYRLNLREVFGAGLNQIWTQLHRTKPDFPAPGRDKSPNPLLEQIADFIIERFKNILISEGFAQDVIEAVISAEGDEAGCDLVESKRKIQSLGEFREAADFTPLAMAFKRVVNIAKGQTKARVRRELFADTVEGELYKSYTRAKAAVEQNIAMRKYPEALAEMKTLKDPVDRFFETVLVMDKNEDIRENRLSMLLEIRDLFFKIADFSKISA
ncbi:MAG: glycine--tRNA ligase subunit beta [Deltaproteobacteria bacterium]